MTSVNDGKESCVKKRPEDFAQSWLAMYINYVFDERFKSYVDKTEDLSVLTDLDFRNNLSETSRNVDESGEERGYKNEHVCDFYVIRYAYAYEYEYRKMYEIVLDKLKEEQSDSGMLHITTIGCGNMIDLWGFVDALGRLEKNNYEYEYRYRGIDLIDWGDLRIDKWMKTQKRSDGNVGYYLPGRRGLVREASFVQADLADEIRNGNTFSDIYMFANSISELDEDLLRDFCSCITAENGKDRFFLLITIRDKDGGNQDEDLKKLNLMVKELRQRGYDTEDDFENPVNHEVKIEGDGQEPYAGSDIAKKKIMDFLTIKLKEKLTSKQLEGENARIYPMFRAKYLNYFVLSFKKK